MNFVNIYVEVLKNFGDFKSRSGKTEFWVFFLGCILVSVVLGMLSFRLSNLFSLIIFVPSIAVGARRLHDIGKSGWQQLWMLLPIIGWIYLIILWLKDGDVSENKWGMPPANVEI